ncbi:MAG TPA: SDR family NAD(P)-dependent oxidoreductase, partial [Anaerolineales bacterium]|nr:SDR family NAD(P)-dependent oxidoreductase [Anaerolineales bacterium]
MHTLKTAFITGADKGLGFSLVQRLLQEGTRVFAGQYDLGSKLSRLAGSFPQTFTSISLDVSQTESVRAAARRVAELTPALDLLINNAAVMLETRTPLPELDLDQLPLYTTLDVNAFGPLRMVQQFLPLLEKGERKMIVNISSEAGSIANCWRESEFAYSMSKAALNMQSKILQNYLKPRGFKVLAIHPGWLQTDMGGAGATVDPGEAAEGILRLAKQDWAPD